MNSKIPHIVLIFLVLLGGCNLPQPVQPTSTTSTSPVSQTLSSLTENPAAPQEVIDLRMASILSPLNGETYPLLAALPVVTVVVSNSPVIVQELLVNGEVAVTQRGEEVSPQLDWAAISPGTKQLQVRAQTEDGQVFFSETVEVVISPQPVGFDLLHTTAAGETLTRLAAQFGRAPSEILASNPGLSAAPDDPLPADLLLRIPFRPILPPGFLTETAAENPAPSSVPALPPFSPAKPPWVDLKSPPIFEKVYYYLSLNGGPWNRVPREGQFLTPSTGYFYLEEALKGVVAAPSQGTLRVEVDTWGWSGGALIYIGRFERILTAQAGGEPWVILPGELKICDLSAPTCRQGLGEFREAASALDAVTRELQWTPPSGASGGIWQVSRFPYGEVCTPQPGGVFQSGSVSVNSSSNIIFEVSFPAPGSDLYSIPIPQPGGGVNYLPSTSFPQTYYVRILPVFNENVKCVPSNTVTMTLGGERPEITVQTPTPQPAAPVPPELFDVQIVDFNPIQFPDYQYQYCVQIVENPFFEKKAEVVDSWLSGPYVVAGQIMMLKDIPPGSILCPQPYVYQEPPFLEKAGQFLKDALNTISQVYEVLKGLAVKLLVKAIPYCYAGEFIEAYKSEIDAVCNTAAEVIVQAAMTYVGLPPSIPNYEQLKDTAKGKITELAVQQLEEQTGLPCIEICEDFIRDRVDEVWAAGEGLLSSQQQGCVGAQEAHSRGFEPLCLPGIVKTAPVPESLYLPATVQVRVTRRADVPDSALPNGLLFNTTCRLNISTPYAKNDAYTGQSIFVGKDYYTNQLVYWQGETLTAEYLFKNDGIGLDFNEFTPGSSQDFYFALEPNVSKLPPLLNAGKFWLPGRLKIYQDYLQNNYGSDYWVAYDDWMYYYLGAQLTVEANAFCITKPNSKQNLAPSYSSVKDMWVEQISAEK